MGTWENRNTRAGEPGGFTLDEAKLRALRPQLYGLMASLNESAVDNPKAIAKELWEGDIQPAVVVSVSPLLVACYSDELDAVVLLCFPDGLAKACALQPGSRLLTVNSYSAAFPQKDVTPGPQATGRWRSVGPTVADFFTSDTQRLAQEKEKIPEERWAYVKQLGDRYMAENPDMARHGLKYRFRNPEAVAKMKFNPKIKLD